MAQLTLNGESSVVVTHASCAAFDVATDVYDMAKYLSSDFVAAVTALPLDGNDVSPCAMPRHSYFGSIIFTSATAATAGALSPPCPPRLLHHRLYSDHAPIINAIIITSLTVVFSRS